jgi:P27 family predicted phage terminase small subunit
VVRAPSGLGKHGKALWRSILGGLAADWRLDGRELHWLERACRTADEIAALEQAIDRDGATVLGSRKQVIVHPALAEVRALRLTEHRLLGRLELVDPAVRRASDAPAVRRSRRAGLAGGRARRLKAV